MVVVVGVTPVLTDGITCSSLTTTTLLPLTLTLTLSLTLTLTWAGVTPELFRIKSGVEEQVLALKSTGTGGIYDSDSLSFLRPG